jgi:hypothetical protein
MFLRIAIYRRKEIKPGPVGDQLSLKMQYGMSQRNPEKIADAFIRPDCPDTLLATLYFNLKCPAENIKKRLVLKPAITEPWKIDIGQIIQIVKYRYIIHKPEPLEINATRLPELVIQRKHEIFRPLRNGRFRQYFCPEIMLPQG